MKTHREGWTVVGTLLLGCILNIVAGLAASGSDFQRTVPSLNHGSAASQRSTFARRIRSWSAHRNESEPRKQSQAVSYSIARRHGPAKRDFQDHNPPKTAEELYSRYDPSVAVSTGVVLGGLLGFIVGRVVLKCIFKLTKRQLRKTRRFAKYFPERELPPLHVAQQIAREHGIALPESLISKLVRAGSDANLRLIADTAKSPAAITAAAMSPLMLQQQPALTACQSPPAGELLGLIRVNIIGATPSITPSASHKILPALVALDKRNHDQQQQNVPNPTLIRSPSGGKLTNVTSAKSVDSDSRTKNALVVTTATIETQPLLLSTTPGTTASSCGRNASFSGGISSSRTSSHFSNNFVAGTRMATEARLPGVHRSSFRARTASGTSYCLSNGGAVVNAGALGQQNLTEH